MYSPLTEPQSEYTRLAIGVNARLSPVAAEYTRFWFVSTSSRRWPVYI